VWYFNWYAPAKRISDAKDLVRDIGAPTGFGAEGEPRESSVGKTVIDVEASYEMRCPKNVCPTSAAAAIVTWATKAGATQVTNKYLNDQCVQTQCYVKIKRDGFDVILYFLREPDYDAGVTTPQSIRYEVTTRVDI
jgi:hypothetical protein